MDPPRRSRRMSWLTAWCYNRVHRACNRPRCPTHTTPNSRPKNETCVRPYLLSTSQYSD